MDLLRAMSVFAAVADAGSFAGAARKLDAAPAVVTRLVAELESHLGARLLNRTTRRVSLTDVGEAYLQRVRLILAEVDEATALAAAATTTVRGLLRVLIPPGLAIWLARRLPELRRRHPQLTVEFTSVGIVTGPDDGYDVSILIVPADAPLDGRFVARLLAHSDVVLCASPAYLASRPPLRQPADVQQHDCLVPAMPSQPRVMGLTHRRTQERVEVRPPAAFVSNHADTLQSAAVAGLGLLPMPSYLIEQSLGSGALVRVLPDWFVTRYNIYAAMPTRQYLPARTRAFIDFLVECMGGEDRDPWLAAHPAAAPAARSARRRG